MVLSTWPSIYVGCVKSACQTRHRGYKVMRHDEIRIFLVITNKKWKKKNRLVVDSVLYFVSWLRRYLGCVMKDAENQYNAKVSVVQVLKKEFVIRKYISIYRQSFYYNFVIILAIHLVLRKHATLGANCLPVEKASWTQSHYSHSELLIDWPRYKEPRGNT